MFHHLRPCRSADNLSQPSISCLSAHTTNQGTLSDIVGAYYSLGTVSRCEAVRVLYASAVSVKLLMSSMYTVSGTQTYQLCMQSQCIRIAGVT